MSTVESKETSHFWIGHFPNARRVAKYFKESRGEDDAEPISQFAADQKARSYDHDAMEHGFKARPKTLSVLVHGYSYSEQWSEEFSRIAMKKKLEGMNMFVFISECEIEKPKSVRNEEHELHYLGKISYEI